jgi:hypothetical protein
MAVKMNDRGSDPAKSFIGAEQYVLDGKGAWSEHQPSAIEENKYIEENGWGAYSRWYLGIDDQAGEETKARYKFPYTGSALMPPSAANAEWEAG